MNKLFTGLIILFIVVVLVSLILHLIYNTREGFGGGGHGGGRGEGSGSYQNSYNGIDPSNYLEGYKNKKVMKNMMEVDPCYKGPKKPMGNSYFDYPYDGWWSDFQTKDEQVRGCINICMLNGGIEEATYNNCVSMCSGA